MAQGKNKYGDADFSRLFDELNEFGEIYLSGGKLSFFYGYIPTSAMFEAVESWLEETPPAGVIPEEGIDFEHWCAARLEEQGWSTMVSRASGDQGVDVVASRGGVSVAIQCKRYLRPVSNTAVQGA